MFAGAEVSDVLLRSAMRGWLIGRWWDGIWS